MPVLMSCTVPSRLKSSGGLSSAFDRTFSLGAPEHAPNLATPSGRASLAPSNGNGSAAAAVPGQQWRQEAAGQQAVLQQQQAQQQRGKGGLDDSAHKLRKVSGRLFGEPSARSAAYYVAD